MRFLSILLLFFALPMFAEHDADGLEFANTTQQKEFMQLTREIRCVTCQNQSIAESNAPIANDLRRKVHAQLLKGDRPHEIKRYLVTRYGDSILFSPPFNQRTAMLWLLPFVLLASAFGFLYVKLYR